MLTSICSRSSSADCFSGGSKSSSSPPESRRLLSSRRPSTSTFPVSSSRSATPREPTSGREARKRSSRSPAASSGTRCFTHAPARASLVRPSSPRSTVATDDRARPRRLSVGGHERQQQSRYAYDDEGVGQVEGRPIFEVEEVRDVPEPDPVGEIRDAATDYEPERNRQDWMPRARAGE